MLNGTHGHVGLTTLEASQRQARFGFNEILDQKRPAWIRLIRKLVSPIPLMIEMALGLSVLVGRWEDFVIIAILLVVNVTVDFLQERKADKALATLTKTLAITVFVLRDGTLQKIPARELVPGDVVKLSIGDIAPADLKLIDSVVLEVDQSAITGESLPVSIEKNGIIAARSIIQKGAGYAEVTATGARTTLGISARLASTIDAESGTHFQRAVLKIGRFLIIFSLLVIMLASVTLAWRGETFFETVRFAIVLMIASIPVALPAVLSVTMAIGAAALARRHAVVADFKAVEELAGVDQLCIDKTGTLTKNVVEAFLPKVYGSYSEQELYTYALLATEAKPVTSIERALAQYAQAHGFEKSTHEYTCVSYIPFDPDRKFTEVVVSKDGRETTVVMGAAQVVLKMVPDVSLVHELQRDVTMFATQGFTTLMVGVSHSDRQKFEMVGLIPLMDPPREDSAAVVRALSERGITVRMLTGDNSAIASNVAGRLNIGTATMISSQLTAVLTSGQPEDRQKLHDTNVFAEVVPADKYHIVDFLRTQGHIVAMTGDGVNDAPALRKADVGISAMGATAAARKSADLVLIDASLDVIREAVDQARMTFVRMRSYATFRISETIRIVLFIALAILVFEYSPLTSVMIILLALLNDIPVLAIAYDNVPLSRKPVRWNIPEMLTIATILGLLGVLSSFLLLYYLNALGVPKEIIQTIIFLKLDMAGHLAHYITRTGRDHFWQRPLPSLRFLLPGVFSRLLALACVLFGLFMPAINIYTVGLVWMYVLIWFVISDWVKVWLFVYLDWMRQRPSNI